MSITTQTSYLPLADGDEVVSATRYARDSANGVEEQVLVITREGDVMSLIYDATRKVWGCRPAKITVLE